MPRRILFSSLIALSALVWTSQAAAQTVIRGPYLQNATSTSMVVRWRTNMNTDSRVIYGLSPGGLSSEVTDGTMTTEHEIQLTALSPETTYYYAIGHSSSILAGGDSDHYFITAPVPGTEPPVRVWVIGDSGTANSSARAVRNAYLAFNGATYTRAWLMLGDNAYSDGTDSQYQNAVFDMYPSLLRQTALWATLGNHDGHSADSGSQTGPYYNIFTLPKFGEAGGLASGTEAYYSFDYANVHFICLDSYDSSKSPGGAMLTWLENDLAATLQKWIVAFWHHPPYSKGSHNSDSSGTLTSVRENFLPILESYGVDLVLSGHSHSYERSYQIDGHYGSSGSFTPSQHLIDGGDGREDGNGAYFKDMLGAVYIVAGSSGKTSGGSLNHPIMYLSLNRLGSLVLDFAGDRLDVKFLDDGGSIRDYFTILKAPAGNQAPEASAGAEQSVIFPADVILDGTVTDDGLPNDTLTTTWSQVSGPGAVTFVDASAVDTTASFIQVGTYILRLTANDGELENSDDVTIYVLPEGTINQPPIVDAGPNQTVALSISAILDGTVTDDSLPNPPGTVTTIWSQVSGPGTVTFADVSAVDTTASFSMEGTYVLSLTADDGSAIDAFDEVTITVEQAPQMLEIRVSASYDDAEESQSGSVNRTSSDLELIRESSDQTVGMRFNGVIIPQGAAITNAYIQFQVDETDSGATYLTIEGQNIGNAPTFSSSSGNISSRARTTASVSWNPVPWTSTGQAGLDQQTPDIALVIQEIINRSDWFEGNSLVIIITGTGKRVAESRNGSSSGAPLLHVEYTTGPVANRAPSVDAGPDQTVTLPTDAFLDGTVTDDGLPSDPGVVTTTWSMVSGPGTVSFGNLNAVDTTISSLIAGTYVLRLTANDSEFVSFDELTITVWPEGTQASTIEIRVEADNDDAEERSSSSMYLTSTDLELVYDSGNQTVGMRFNGVTIPQGAAISNAYIQFQAEETHSGATYLTIEGQNIGNAPTFSSSSGNISSRARTEAPVSWDPVPWTRTGEAGPDQQTPNIASIIQQIVSRSDWSNGNSLVIIITGTGERSAESYDGRPSGAPLLHVEYYSP